MPSNSDTPENGSQPKGFVHFTRCVEDEARASLIRNAIGGIVIVDRQKEGSAEKIDSILGDLPKSELNAHPGRWLIGVIEGPGLTLYGCDSEERLFAFHRNSVDLMSTRPGQLMLSLFIDADLRRRLIDTSREHALRIAACGGEA